MSSARDQAITWCELAAECARSGEPVAAMRALEEARRWLEAQAAELLAAFARPKGKR